MSATCTAPAASLGLIAPIARAVARRFRDLTTFADLVQLGALGLIAATADLDPARDRDSQCAYLRQRIRGAMLDSLRRELQRHEVTFAAEPAARSPARTMGELLLLLPARQRQVLELRIQGYTQTETGVACRISQSRVSRLEKRAIDTLRKRAA